MEETVSLIGLKNKFLPRIAMIAQPLYIRLIYYAVYTLVWAAVVHISDTYSDRIPVGVGFACGLAILFLIDYIDNYSHELLVDKALAALVKVDKSNTYMVLNNDYIKLNHKDALWMKKKKFDYLVKTEKLKVLPLGDWMEKEYSRSYGSTSVGDPTSILQSSGLRILAGSYMIMSLITIGVLSSNISVKLSKKIFPYIIVGAILALALPSVWLVDLGAVTLATNALVKTKSLVTAISLGVCAALLFIIKK